MRTHGVVVPSPGLDHNLGLVERVEDLPVEQFIAQFTSVTPIARIASTTAWPCDVSTSTCRSFATISSAVCLFLPISVSSSVKNRHQGGPLQRGQIIVNPQKPLTSKIILSDLHPGLLPVEISPSSLRYPLILLLVEMTQLFQF